MSATIPSSKIINIFDATKSSTVSVNLDIGPSLGLDSVITVRYIRLPIGELHECRVQERLNVICYILSGNGQLKKGERTAHLDPTDCFSIPAADSEDSFTLMAGPSEFSVLMISDIRADQRIASVPTPGFPKIVSAQTSAAWMDKGIGCTKAVRLGKVTDMGEQERSPWGLTLERIPPGTQSSNAHAHSLEDEFVLVLEGKARYWHHGESPERILLPGDAVGWKAGTGVCHALFNDAEDEAGAGHDLVFLVWGGSRRGEDKIHYATANPPWWTSERRWWDCPVLPVGPASALPRHPRPDNRPYSP